MMSYLLASRTRLLTATLAAILLITFTSSFSRAALLPGWQYRFGTLKLNFIADDVVMYGSRLSQDSEKTVYHLTCLNDLGMTEPEFSDRASRADPCGIMGDANYTIALASSVLGANEPEPGVFVVSVALTKDEVYVTSTPAYAKSRTTPVPIEWPTVYTSWVTATAGCIATVSLGEGNVPSSGNASCSGVVSSSVRATSYSDMGMETVMGSRTDTGTAGLPVTTILTVGRDEEMVTVIVTGSG